MHAHSRAHKTPPLNLRLLQSVTDFRVISFPQIYLNNILAVSPVFSNRSLQNNWFFKTYWLVQVYVPPRLTLNNKNFVHTVTYLSL
jgi:hypothetical protein